MSPRKTARAAGFFFMTAFIALLLALISKPALAEEPNWLKEVSAGRVSVLYSKAIPAAEARLFLEESGRAMDFLDLHYPLPYPAIPRARLLLVTGWNDYRFGASFKHRGLLRMYVSPPSLYVFDCYESVLSFMGSRFFISGMAQFLADRYRGEDSTARAALLMQSTGRVSLRDLYKEDGAAAHRLNGFYSASFLAHLVDRFGWSRVIDFAATPRSPDDLSQSLQSVFGVSEERLELDWIGALSAVNLDHPPFDADRYMAQDVRFARLAADWSKFSVAFNRTEVVTAFTLARFLLQSPVETPAIEKANDRLEGAIRKARLVNNGAIWGPIILIVLHAAPVIVRRRRRLVKFRRERGRLPANRGLIAPGENSPGSFVTGQNR